MKENGHAENHRGHVEVNREVIKFIFFPDKSKMMIPSLEEKWN